MSELKKIPAFGPERARIMIVGEAPGADEEKEGQPFVGAAGKLLRQYLMEVGIDPTEVFYTNICKYRPPNNKLEKFFLDDGVPNQLVLAGLIELKEEILRVSPNIIVAAGNFAMWALTKKAKWLDYTKEGERIRGFSGIQTWRGSLLRCTLLPRSVDFIGYKVLPTFHPSYINREGMKDHGTFKADLAKVKEEAKSPILERPKREIILAETEPKRLVAYKSGGEHFETWADIPGLHPDFSAVWEPMDQTREELREEFLCRLPKAQDADIFSTPLQLLTLDIEMQGPKCHCVGVTNRRDRALVIPTRSMHDFFYMQSIATSGVGINAQNSMFDGAMMEWHLGCEIMPFIRFDTMFAAHSAEIELPKGLDYLASVHTKMPYWKDMVTAADWKQIQQGKKDPSITYAYNGEDVWSQHEIAEVQILDQLDDPGVRSTFLFEMTLLVPLWHMSRRGIPIDKDLIAEKKAELTIETQRLGMEILLLAGKPVNPRPSNSCTEFLYEKMHLPILKRGKGDKAKPSTDDKTLAALATSPHLNPIQKQAVTLVRQYRVAANLMSKFFDIEFDADGRMRGHYDPTKTVTGRLASRKFFPTGKGTNQQNIPRDKRARRVFLADPKKVFFYADLERAESLVVAHITGDPRMLADHEPGVDAHKSLAAALYNLPEDEITEDQRYIGKKTRHAGNYMQGPVTFMKNFNQDAHKTGLSITFAEAKTLIERFKSLHPFLEKWWKDTESTLWRTRTLHNLLGHRRIFYGHIRGIIPEAVAYVPQSTVGATLNIGLLNAEGIPSPYMQERGLWDEYREIGAELREYGYESLMQIHDAIAGQVWEKDVDKALPLIKRAMEIPLRNPRTYEDFVIPAEVLADLDPMHIAENKSNWGDTLPVHFKKGTGEQVVERILKDGKVKGYNLLIS
jgi:uracil-DNA glycosylase family 4